MLFHCTDSDSAKAILEGGYRAAIKPHWVGDFLSLFFQMLPESSRRRILPSFATGDVREAELKGQFFAAVYAAKGIEAKVQRAWLRRFGQGTIIWVTRGRPWQDEYGDEALIFTPPEEAVEMAHGEEERTMYYVPSPVVPARHFSQHSTVTE